MAGGFGSSPPSKYKLATPYSNWYEIALTNQCSTSAYENRHTTPEPNLAVTPYHQQEVPQYTDTPKSKCVSQSITWFSITK
jgi:hypothetical protein